MSLPLEYSMVFHCQPNGSPVKYSNGIIYISIVVFLGKDQVGNIDQNCYTNLIDS